jgi:hypothetical protein
MKYNLGMMLAKVVLNVTLQLMLQMQLLMVAAKET